MAHEVVLNGLMKTTAEEMTFLAAANHDKAIVKASVLNGGSGTKMKLHDKHNWSGAPFPLYPQEFAKDSTGEFVHKGVRPKDIRGSKGAVVYSGTNESGSSTVFDCAWLLAWHVPLPGSSGTNKVYVEAGDIEKYPQGAIDWAEIERQLDASPASSTYWDEDTNCEASAQIEDGSKNIAGLTAIFDVKTI